MFLVRSILIFCFKPAGLVDYRRKKSHAFIFNGKNSGSNVSFVVTFLSNVPEANVYSIKLRHLNGFVSCFRNSLTPYYAIDMILSQYRKKPKY